MNQTALEVQNMLRKNRIEIRLSDNELTILKSAAVLDHSTTKGVNLGRAIREWALSVAGNQFDPQYDPINSAESMRAAHQWLQAGALPVVAHMRLFAEVKAYAERVNGGGSGLDWYHDGAALHNSLNDTLTDALTADDEPSFIVDDGRQIVWDEATSSWRESDTDVSALLRDLVGIDETTDLAKLTAGLNRLGELVRALEGSSDGIAAFVKHEGGKIIHELGDNLDHDNGPADTAGVWAWDDTHQIESYGWRFELVKRDDGDDD